MTQKKLLTYYECKYLFQYGVLEQNDRYINDNILGAGNTTFENGEIQLAGIRAQELAKEFGTPAFIIDEDDFRSRVQDFRKALDSTFKIQGQMNLINIKY